MKTEYKKLFEKIKESYPNSYSEIVKEYLDKMEQTIKSNSLLQINILNCFKENYEEMIEIFPFIYRKFIKTDFNICELSDKEIEIICDSYINEVHKIGSEYINDIKKNI